MRNALDFSQTTLEIRTVVDDIATQVMLGGESLDQGHIEAWVKNLDSLKKAASQAQLNEVSQWTAHLAHSLQTQDLPLGDGARVLDSITKLQEALERSEELLGTGAHEANEPEERTPAAPVHLSLSADPELVAEFVMESTDHLASIEGNLLAIENDPSHPDAVHAIFRSFHTIKGLAGFLDFPAIKEVAHEVETLLDLARNGQISINASVVDVILESADYLKAEIERVDAQLQGKTDAPPADNSSLLRRVLSLMDLKDENSKDRNSEDSEPELENAVVLQSETTDLVRTEPVDIAPTTPMVTQLASRAEQPETGTPLTKTGPEKRTAANDASRFIKVDTAKLDFLVDMVGELVISQSILRHDEHITSAANPKLQRNISQLTRITTDVQKTAMSMRMIPIGQLFQRSVRLVRDLSRKSGKLVDLEMAGEDTELDRTLVEDLADPVMHMIRNAADHGVELPEERAAQGKNPVAKICLKAYHQAGHIVIELSDDGRGLNRDKILRKARERGLVTDGSQLSDPEVFDLIFEPGFSTAEKVTDLSGRGVGMDVVRRQVQKLRGRIEIISTLGKGTTFRIKLPLTLAIIDGLLVSVGQERYIVPIYAVREMFRPASDKVFTIEGKAEMVLVRGSLLPVIRLHKLFGVTPRSEDAASSLVIIAESGPHRFCLLVDEMLGKQEVVIKALGDSFKNVGGIAGGAILGDGRVGLILDIDAIFGDRAHAAASAH